MTPTLFATLATLLTILLPTFGRADTTIRLDGSRQAANVVIQVKGELARLAVAGQPAYVIYDKGRNIAVYVDTAGKTYTEIDQPTLEKYAGMMTTVRRQLQMLPPAQRALLEQQMGNLTGISGYGAMPDLGALHSVARGSRLIGGFHCQLHEIVEALQPVGDVCLSTAAEAGISPADFATLMAMMDFLRQAAGLAQEFTGGLTENARLLLSGLRGVPVAARDFRSREQINVAGVFGEPLNAGLFNGYHAYHRQDLLETIPLMR